MAANMWKNSLKNVESENNKRLYETLFDFFKRNGTSVWISLVQGDRREPDVFEMITTHLFFNKKEFCRREIFILTCHLNCIL